MGKTPHNKPEGAGKPKFRKNWKNWEEDRSRVFDKEKYAKNLSRIFGHHCKECGGEKLQHIYVHEPTCSQHPENK